MLRPLVARLHQIVRWPLAVWLVGLGLVLLVRFPVKFLLEAPFLMDFNVFHTVAVRLVSGGALHLYEPVETAQMMFKYAPCWALFIAPFGWLSAHLGGVIWSSLNVFCLLATCWMADRLCRTMGVKTFGVLAIPAVLLLVRPITSDFLLGQTNLLWGFLVVSFFFFETIRRPWVAAVCLALAISLKLPALLVVVYLAIRGRWRTLGQVLLCAVLLNAIAACLLLPTQPLHLFRSWVQTLLVSAPDRAFEIGNQSFLALTGRLLRNDGYGFNLLALSDATVAVVALVLQVGLFVALFTPRRLSQPASTTTILDGALLMVCMVLFSPTCWIATYNAMLFPVFVALALLVDRPRHTVTQLPLALGILAIGFFSLLTHSKFWRFVKMPYLRGESYVYLVLMILPWFGLSLAWYLWHQQAAWSRRPRQPHPASP